MIEPHGYHRSPMSSASLYGLFLPFFGNFLENYQRTLISEEVHPQPNNELYTCEKCRNTPSDAVKVVQPSDFRWFFCDFVTNKIYQERWKAIVHDKRRQGARRAEYSSRGKENVWTWSVWEQHSYCSLSVETNSIRTSTSTSTTSHLRVSDTREWTSSWHLPIESIMPLSSFIFRGMDWKDALVESHRLSDKEHVLESFVIMKRCLIKKIHFDDSIMSMAWAGKSLL